MAVQIEHKNITDPNLHEPKGVTGANAGDLYYADGSGSGAWQEADAYSVIRSSTTVAQADSTIANGSYYTVPSATLGGFLDLYLKVSSGQSTFINTKPSLYAVNNAIDLYQFSPGAVGIWFMDQYQATPRPQVPNALNTSIPLSKNLYTGSRRLFAFPSNGSRDWWSGGTNADFAVTDIYGNTEASTVVEGSGNWLLVPNCSDTLPAGTYTVACNAKRNTGTNQTFSFTGDNTSNRSATKTATSSWQRFSYTFTNGSTHAISAVGLCSIDGSTAANLQIDNLELFAGSADLGPEVFGGHLILGGSAYTSTIAAPSGGYIDFSTSGNMGIAQLSAARTVRNFTAMCLTSKIAAGSNYQSFLNNLQDYGKMGAFFQQLGLPTVLAGGVQANFNQSANTLWDITGKGGHVFTARYDGTTINLMLDDVKLFSQATTAPVAARLTDLAIGMVSVKSLNSGNKINSIAFWDRATSDAEWRSDVIALTNHASRSGISVPTLRVYCAEGDSITGAFDYSYPYLFAPNASPVVYGCAYAVTGNALGDLVNRAATVDAAIPPNKNGRTFILSVLIGANDLDGYAPSGNDATAAANYTTALAAYCDARRTAGWKVIICTILPRSASHHNARRAIVNANITGSWLGVHADAICDFAADATMGPDAAASNTTYYSAGLHPTAVGQAILETIIRPVINAL